MKTKRNKPNFSFNVSLCHIKLNTLENFTKYNDKDCEYLFLAFLLKDDER